MIDFFRSIFGQQSEPESPSQSQYQDDYDYDLESALDYFKYDKVECHSRRDRDTLIRLHKALTENNHDTCDQDNMTDAMSALDSNVYNLCDAIITQNFMLMRKMDYLIKKVGRLEYDIRSMQGKER